MKNEAAISVVIPVYNVKDYVCDSIDSVLGQTFHDYEVIVINDQSTDGSFDLVKQKYGNCPNFSFMENHKNLGLGETRNIGTKVAKGKYIYFLDSDDMILDNTLNTLYSIAEDKHADVIHMNAHYRPYKEDFHYGDEKTGLRAKIFRDKLLPDEICQLSDNIHERLDACYTKAGISVMMPLNLYRREFLIENNIYSLPIIYEDTPFTLACLAATNRIWSVPASMYIYRQRKGSVSYDTNAARKAGRLAKALVFGLRYIEEEIPRLLPEKENIDISGLKSTYFYKMYAKILELFAKTNRQEQEAKFIDAIEGALYPLMGADSFFINILLYSLQWHQRKATYLQVRSAHNFL